ncbi:hypothetical protein F5Y11DRAFT_211050 [Daldinia sp. FL1419]|nr:hypothetical protein F5Y11DRAFT_211050 [Daldinia sp. FL1419]
MSKQEQRPTMESLGLRESGLRFPTTNNRIVHFPPDVIRQDALDTRVVVHGKFPLLVEQFLAHKRTYGSSIEKQLYGPDWTFSQQVARLLQKRALSFVGSGDSTLLRTGQTFAIGDAFWDSVGVEGTPFEILEEYLTYDEIMLGSLMGVSGPSYFINAGSRYNRSEIQDLGTFEPRGIIIGLVGARFERPGRMDSNFILAGDKRKRQHPELTRIFLDFFGVTKKQDDHIRGFSPSAYFARMRITSDILLLEANERAKAVGRKAYVYIVGLGLGVWARDQMQPSLYIDAFKSTLITLKKKLKNIGTLDFAWISPGEESEKQIAHISTAMGIVTKFSKNNPADLLGLEESRQLLVVSYAWDGNAFPGNEYWQGSLTASGDPAAACMSTIAELHNPLVNPNFTQRIMVVDSDYEPSKNNVFEIEN